MFDKSRFRTKIAELVRLPPSQISDDDELTELVTESFALVEMMIELQEEFHVRFVAQDELANVRTVGDLAALFESRTAQADAASTAADPAE
jgi:acyl carrier protein